VTAASPEQEAAIEVRVPRRETADPAGAAEAFVREHWDTAYRTAFLIVQDATAAEDVAQEAMLAALRAMDRFDRRRRPGPWVHRIVANKSIDWLRARQRRAEVAEIEAEGEAPAPDALPAELAAALGALEPDERAIVVLRHLLDYSSREIARMLDMPAATVRTKLRRSLERLRTTLEEEGS
jgi:RNA polymerase sigma-70 factor (ECF subfamily)